MAQTCSRVAFVTTVGDHSGVNCGLFVGASVLSVNRARQSGQHLGPTHNYDLLPLLNYVMMKFISILLIIENINIIMDNR